MIENDYENLIRLAHTIERQIFDEKLYLINNKNQQKLEIETKIFELLDLFIRDSSLG